LLVQEDTARCVAILTGKLGNRVTNTDWKLGNQLTS